MNDFERRILETMSSSLRCADLDTIQANIGLVCNQECVHCHVAASPRRRESMSWEIMEMVAEAARKSRCRLIDITGGAPELHPHFLRFVELLRQEGFLTQVRTNLTVLLEPEMKDIPAFLRDRQIPLAASLPCYLEKNVDSQRGAGVYAKSIQALLLLNSYGYGIEPELPLNLVYNPLGPLLPPKQAALQEDYRRELKVRFGVEFTHLICIANMPIGRFLAALRQQKKDGEYLRLLMDSFNPETLDYLMCRHQINVNWDGTLFDCDFNLALRWGVDASVPRHIRDFDPAVLVHRPIVTGEHCFGCTAGCGSSCSGSLIHSLA
ncbi:MAG: arsenosugar biosynthesis radical SAM (seleno)protein ArsS [Candidatus Omnitrophota bacterium]